MLHQILLDIVNIERKQITCLAHAKYKMSQQKLLPTFKQVSNY